MANINTKSIEGLSMKYAAHRFDRNLKRLFYAVREEAGVGIGVADFTSKGVLFIFMDEEGAYSARDLAGAGGPLTESDVKENPANLETFGEMFHILGDTEVGLTKQGEELLRHVGLEDENITNVREMLEDVSMYFELGTAMM